MGQGEGIHLSGQDELGTIGLLDDGGLLIAASPALAADWRARHADARPGIVETPQITTWHAWIEQLGMDDLQAPVPLTALQEAMLWEKVVRDDQGKSVSAGSLRGLAAQAAASYALIVQYRIPLADLAGSFSEESEALCRWIGGVHDRLSSGTLAGRALAADMPRLLLERGGRLPAGQPVIFDGFLEYTPLQQAWQQALHKAGCGLHVVCGGPAAQAADMHSFSDTEHEMQQVAMAVRDRLEANPAQRIAIVLPQGCDQQRLRGALDAELLGADALQPEPREQAVHMQGQSLAELPMGGQILHLLSLAGRGTASFADLSRLLFMPGLDGYADERFSRAALDAGWRKANRHVLSCKSLLAGNDLHGMPALTEIIGHLLAWKKNAQSAREWVLQVHALLQSVGFLRSDAQEGRRSDAEVQQLNALRDVLGSLVAADALDEKLEWERFLSQLRSACRQERLPLPARYPQVSVVPLKSIPGLRFDVVYALGMDADALPLPVSVHPLIAPAVQRAYGLPDATPQAAYRMSVFYHDQLLGAAPEVHLGFAREREGGEQRVSPLFAGLEVRSVEMMAEHQAGCAPAPMEAYDDAPDVPLAEGGRVSGGTALIRDQSACPFRAFAGHRLGIAGLEDTEPGMQATEKGSLIHKALEYIWLRLRGQQALQMMEDEGVAMLLDDAVKHAWQAVRFRPPESVRLIEQRRMRAVLAEWLQLERERPPFTVQACESRHELTLPESSGVQIVLRIQIDRLDADDDGHRILIDYKTGRRAGASKWLGSRMEEPQLPLYSMAAGLGEGDAAAFARVRSGEPGFEGLSGVDTGIKGITLCDGKRGAPEDWGQVLEVWRQDINALAAEFVQGRSDVSPRDTGACRYCGLEAVCRIDETGFDADPDDEGGSR